MTIDESFGIALKVDQFGSLVFYFVTSISMALVVFPGSEVGVVLYPMLVLGAVLSVLGTIATTIYQVRGNRLLRMTQLSDAFGANFGEESKEGYFASSLEPSTLRLASTTLQNTHFTKGVLAAMLRAERIKNGIFLVILVLMFSIRWTKPEWLVLLAQTIFSADLILFWIRMERFQIGTIRANERLLQFFQQGGTADNHNGTALILSAFADYECIKDEAAMPLDQRLFKKLNLSLSKEWDSLSRRLGFGESSTGT